MSRENTQESAYRNAESSNPNRIFSFEHFQDAHIKITVHVKDAFSRRVQTSGIDDIDAQIRELLRKSYFVEFGRHQRWKMYNPDAKMYFIVAVEHSSAFTIATVVTCYN